MNLWSVLKLQSLIYHLLSIFKMSLYKDAISKIEKNEMGWACGAYG